MVENSSTSESVSTPSNEIENVNFFQSHPAITYPYLIVLVLFTIVGNGGNIMVVGALLTDKRLKTKGNVFILNLSIADLCVTGFVNPFSILGVILGPNFFTTHMALCHIVGSICLASCVCSLWNIAAISINRYILICKNHLYDAIFSWKSTVAYAVGIWLFAWSLDLPNYLYWGSHTFDMKTMACSYDRLASYSYTIFFLSMFVVIPLLTVLFCNIKIYTYVRENKLRLRKNQIVPKSQIAEKTEETTLSPNRSFNVSSVSGSIETNGTNARFIKAPKFQSGDVRLARTLFIVFLVFLVCWSPYALLCLFDFADNAPKIFYVISITLAHTNSSINSILYAATNRNFREGYKVFIHRCIKGKRHDSRHFAEVSFQ